MMFADYKFNKLCEAKMKVTGYAARLKAARPSRSSAANSSSDSVILAAATFSSGIGEDGPCMGGRRMQRLDARSDGRFLVGPRREIREVFVEEMRKR